MAAYVSGSRIPFIRLLAGALAYVLLTGCRSTAPAARTRALPASLRAASVSQPPQPNTTIPLAAKVVGGITAVHSKPLYKQAEAACKHKQFVHAAELLTRLSHDPGLSTEQAEFCVSQANVCRKDAGLPPKQAMNLTAAVRTPKTQYPVPTSDCGPRALAEACARLAIRTDVTALSNAAGTTKDGTSMEGLAAAAKSLGLKAEGVQVGREALRDVPVPCVAWYHGNHYVTLIRLAGGTGDNGSATIIDPNDPGHEQTISQESLLRRSGGYLMLLRR